MATSRPFRRARAITASLVLSSSVVSGTARASTSSTAPSTSMSASATATMFTIMAKTATATSATAITATSTSTTATFANGFLTRAYFSIAIMTFARILFLLSSPRVVMMRGIRLGFFG